MPDNRLLISYHNDEKSQELTAYFEESGYRIATCPVDGEILDFLDKDSQKPDLVILVTAEPDRPLYEIIDRIRSFSNIPVIILSHDVRLETQLYAYSKKVDDYISSSVPFPLLEAHVEALMRRFTEKRPALLSAGELTIDYESRKIYLADQVLKVTAKEFDLMEFFVQHKGMILSRDKILDAVWGYDYVGGYRSVDTLVKKLRAKLTRDYPYIQTVYGVGYCFDV